MAGEKAFVEGHRARLRDRLLEGGGEAFLDYELLEYVLGLVILRQDTKPLAKRLLEEFGSFSSVVSAEIEELTRVNGLGKTAGAALKFLGVAAVRVSKDKAFKRPVLASWQAVIDYLHADMAHIIVERFRVLFLNTKNILIIDEKMQEGTINQTAVYPREIVKRALEVGAASIVLVHNHPSGDANPSRDDIRLTEEIVKACKLFGIKVHDHVIIGRDGHESFAQKGLL